jgi:hypothetical protein
MTADDALNGGESEAAPSLLGGEERIEDARLRLAIHSRPVIGDLHVGIETGCRVGAECEFAESLCVEVLDTASHGDDAAIVHRFGSVDDQIQDDLTNLRWVDSHQRHRAGALISQCAVTCDRRLKQVVHFAHESIKVDQLGDHSTLSGIRQHLRHEIRGTLRPDDDRVSGFAHRRRRRLQRQQVGVTKNRREQVIEVVRHTAGEDAQALDALLFLDAAIELAPLVLSLAACRDIACDDQPAGESFVAVAHRLHLHFEEAAAGGNHHRPGLCTGVRLRIGPPQHRVVNGAPDTVHRAAHPFGRGIEIDDVPLTVKHDHGVIHAFDYEVACDWHKAKQAMTIEAPEEQ